jgi:hypothetical protein
MAKRETVVFSCDLHDGDMTEDVETVTFGLDGAAYEVDACQEHAAALRDAFAPYVGAARKASGGAAASSPRRSSRGASRPASSSGSDREQVQAVREWARENGHKVSERGRLSAAVVSAYDSAH